MSKKTRRRIDQQYLATPFYGSQPMTAELHRAGLQVNRRRVQRLMRLMGPKRSGQSRRPAAARRSIGSTPTCCAA
jgi:hypothetical protein